MYVCVYALCVYVCVCVCVCVCVYVCVCVCMYFTVESQLADKTHDPAPPALAATALTMSSWS